MRSLYEKLRTDIYNMLDYALDADIISNRVEMFSFPKSITVRFKQSEPSKTWTHSQHLALCDFLDSKTDDVFALLFKYQLLTGERFETASAIMPDDIDSENMLLFIIKLNLFIFDKDHVVSPWRFFSQNFFCQ